MHVFGTTEHERNALHTRITHWIWVQIPFWKRYTYVSYIMHACMAILYTLWTKHVKIQVIHALKRQKNTKKCQKYHEKCEKIPVLRGQNREKNSIFDIPLVLSVFFFLITFWKFSCNWPRHWAREDFFLLSDPLHADGIKRETKKRAPLEHESAPPDFDKRDEPTFAEMISQPSKHGLYRASRHIYQRK